VASSFDDLSKANQNLKGLSLDPINASAPIKKPAIKPLPNAGVQLSDYGKVLGAAAVDATAGIGANVLNLTTGGESDNFGREVFGVPLTQAAANASESIKSTLSPAAKEAMSKQFVTDDLSIGDAWSDPNTLGLQLTGSFPAMAMTMAPALMAGKAAGAAATARGASIEQAGKAAERAGMVSGMKANALVAGSLQGQEAAQKVRGMSEQQLLSGSPEYVALREKGLTHEQAQDQVALKANAVTSVIGGAGSSVAGAYFDGFLGKLGAGHAGNRLVAGGKGLVLDVPGEAAQC